MSESLGAPQPATVIAIGLSAGSDPARSHFTDLLGGTLAHTCHIQAASNRDSELAFTAVVPDHAQTLSLLRRLISIQDEFRQTHPECAVRFIVHHGPVFPSAASFVGAALRSAHSRLSRLPVTIAQAATSEFADYVSTWSAHPVTFGKLPLATEIPGLLHFSILTSSSPKSADQPADEEAFLRHITKCLATHLGPFAEVIVDAAKRSSATPRQMIEELASEISDAAAREKFRSDAIEFVSGGAG